MENELNKLNVQNQPTEQKQDTSYFLVDDAVTYLNQTRKWTKFLSILGFIGIGFIVLLALFVMVMGSEIGTYTELPMNSGFGLLGVVYLIFAGIYFIPVYYLYNFSVKMKNALLSNDLATLTKAFRYLRNYYRFIGIFAIVIISLYVLILIFFIIGFGAADFYNL